MTMSVSRTFTKLVAAAALALPAAQVAEYQGQGVEALSIRRFIWSSKERRALKAEKKIFGKEEIVNGLRVTVLDGVYYLHGKPYLTQKEAARRAAAAAQRAREEQDKNMRTIFIDTPIEFREGYDMLDENIDLTRFNAIKKYLESDCDTYSRDALKMLLKGERPARLPGRTMKAVMHHIDHLYHQKRDSSGASLLTIQEKKDLLDLL